MDSKEPKFQISPDSVRSIVHKLKEKGAAQLDSEELFLCVTTLGFAEVCRNLGTEWSAKHEKEAIERIKKSKLEVPWLLKKQTNQAQYGPMLVHCARGDMAKVKDILKKTPKDQLESLREAVDATKKSALHIAAKQGYEVLVEYLLAEGFNANFRDRELKTALHYSCIANAEVVSSILIKKCDTMAKDSKGCAPIHYAVNGTSSKVVHELLEINPRSAELKDYAGKTPLHYAIMSTTENQIDIIRVLLENGARINETDNDGKTALHYASEYGKSRCIPILLKNQANPNIKDALKQTPLDVASNERIKKLLLTYGDDKKLPIPQNEQKQLEEEFESKIHSTSNQKRIDKMKNTRPASEIALKPQQKEVPATSNAPVPGGDVNQVSTWLREKLFVLLKKLQESGVKAKFHIKRPYIFTGSWLENVDSIEDLYTIFGEVSGPQVGMRVFNVLCPYEKKLPTGLGKMEAVQGFFGQNWFGTKPVEEIKKNKGEDKLKRQLAEKDKDIQDLKIQMAALQQEVNRMEGENLNLNDELRQYKKMQDDVRKEKVRTAQQYSQILKLTNENEELKKQVAQAYSGDDEVEKLNKKVEQLKGKNEELTLEIEGLKSYEAAARRKCGKMFLKALQNPDTQFMGSIDNLYDDDSILRLYELLEGNPPSLLKRLQAVDRNGDGKLTPEEFNTFLERLKMLPQDILALNRIVGFVSGRKHLAFEQFKQIFDGRPQLRVQWQKKLINKLREIITCSEVGSVDKLFALLDVDSSGQVSLEELRTGLQNYNIFINQNDLSNLYSLLDSDKSGMVSLQEFRTLLGKGESGKILPPPNASSFKEESEAPPASDRQKSEVSKPDKRSVHQVDEANDNPSEHEENKQPSDMQADKDNEQPEDAEQSHHDKAETDNQQQQEQQQEQPEEHQSEHNQQDGQQPNPDEENYDALKGDEPEAYQENVEEENPQGQPSSDKLDEEEDPSEVGPRVTGVFKLQARFCQNLMDQEQLEKVAILFEFGKEQIAKVGDLAKKKWEIAVKFQVSNKLESSIPNIRISVWKNRDFQEQNYLGQVEIDSRMLMETPDSWVVNGPVQLEARAFEKPVTGSIGVQARWKQEADLPTPQ